MHSETSLSWSPWPLSLHSISSGISECHFIAGLLILVPSGGHASARAEIEAHTRGSRKEEPLRKWESLWFPSRWTSQASL